MVHVELLCVIGHQEALRTTDRRIFAVFLKALTKVRVWQLIIVYLSLRRTSDIWGLRISDSYDNN